MKKYTFFCAIFITIGISAQENLNFVFCNILNYPQAPPYNRDQILAGLLKEMQPDIFMVCKLESENASNAILKTSLNFSTDRFEAAPYVNNTSSSFNLRQMASFDKNKFVIDDNAPITYVEESYAVFGNNGNCYNRRIDDPACNRAYDETVRDSLYQMNDHLPVDIELEADATFLPPLGLEDIAAWSIGSTIVKDLLDINLKYALPNRRVAIYDQTGRLVLPQDIQGNKVRIPSVSISSGVYYALLENTLFNLLKFIKVN